MAESGRRISRRNFLALGAAGLGAAAMGAYSIDVEPFWVEHTERVVPIRNLPGAFEGFRIAHLTDIHHSADVKMDYLEECVADLAGKEIDLLALTGDFITGSAKTYGPPVAKLRSGIRARHGTFAVLGNHDHGVFRWTEDGGNPGTTRAMLDAFENAEIPALRNEETYIEKDGQKLYIAGVEDIWTGLCDTKKNLKDHSPELPIIVLAHNPDVIETLRDMPVDLILSGHTHGGQIRFPIIGPPYMPIRNKKYFSGLYRMNQRQHLYVNRGVGFFYQIRFNARPEVSLITLTAA